VMLVRGGSLSAGMSQYLVEQIKQTPNIHVELNSQVTEAFGTERLEAISILCSTSAETQKVPAASLFIFIGAEPQTDWLHGAVERDEKGFILTGGDLLKAGKPPKTWSLEREPWLLEASVPGIFVAGDVRFRSIKRVASGVGEGANAVQFVHQYLGSV
jgi:thioredoxin reductase (NADPH)